MASQNIFQILFCNVELLLDYRKGIFLKTSCTVPVGFYHGA
jgi:hypothetical protein